MAATGLCSAATSAAAPDAAVAGRPPYWGFGALGERALPGGRGVWGNSARALLIGRAMGDLSTGMHKSINPYCYVGVDLI
jgi:hypothetical protein